MPSFDFEWDPDKNDQNIARHAIDFERAKRVFDGPVLERVDERHNYGETRIIAIGRVEGIEYVVIYTPRGDARRIISARRANRRERAPYRKAFPS